MRRLLHSVTILLTRVYVLHTRDVAHLSMQIYSYIWRHHRWTSGVFLNHCPPHFWNSLSLNLELDWAGWTGLWSQESAFLHLPTTGVVVHAIDKRVRDLNSGCDVRSVNTLPTSAFPQHLTPTDYRIGDWIQYFRQCCTTEQYLYSEKLFLLHLIFNFIYNASFAGLLEFENFFLFLSHP